MHAFPNGWNDASWRVVGLWFFTRASQPKYARASTTASTRFRGRTCAIRRSLATPHVLVDGKPVGAAPVFLSRGRHHVASADRQVKIGLLRIRSGQHCRRRKTSATSGSGIRRRRSRDRAKSTRTPFLLVFNEAYHPEWSATLDGEALPHVIVNGVANGWIVPSLPAGGQHPLDVCGPDILRRRRGSFR